MTPTISNTVTVSPGTTTYNYPNTIHTSNSTGIWNISGNTAPLNTGVTITANTSPYNYKYDYTTAINPISITNNNNSLHVNGDANFEGDVKIKGKSLVESLEKIEEKLAILRPNEQLEKKWDQLRELRKQYMELEKEIIEKEKMWDILKK